MGTSLASRSKARKEPRRVQPDRGDRVFVGLCYAIIAVFTVLCFIPFYTMVLASVTDKLVLQSDGYALWPRQLSLEAYKWVLRGRQVLAAYKVTIFVTGVGTFVSVVIMCGAAYMLANKKFKYRNHLAFYFYFTALFNGGIIPWYITCRKLGLYDNVWALIVPMLVNPWWIFIIRNYFNSLPTEVIESARIDGAGDMRIFFKIMLPLSTPVLATVALFVAIGYWNDWWHGVILLDFADFRPLQVLILRIMNSIRAIREAMQVEGGGMTIDITQIPSLSVRMATAIITIGPIILLYPFVQRYFIKGLTMGALKG